MKYFMIFMGLFLTLYNLNVEAGVISGTKTLPKSPVETIHPGKLLSESCFNEGGNEYYYNATPGSNEIVCLRHYGSHDSDWSILQSTIPDCQVGTNVYEELVPCYDNYLIYMNFMFYSIVSDTVSEFEPYRRRPVATTTTTTTTTTIGTLPPKTVPSPQSYVDYHRESCNTKILDSTKYGSQECFKAGGNEYYHNSIPRVCKVPAEICINRTGDDVVIISSQDPICSPGDTGEALQKCLKKLRRKWSRILPSDFDENILPPKKLNDRL